MELYTRIRCSMWFGGLLYLLFKCLFKTLLKNIPSRKRSFVTTFVMLFFICSQVAKLWNAGYLMIHFYLYSNHLKNKASQQEEIILLILNKQMICDKGILIKA